MRLYRGDLRDEQWQKLQPLLPGKADTDRSANDHRQIINGILWIQRTGAPWDDLPERYGSRGTVSSRFYRWRTQGVWQQILERLQQQADAIDQIDWEVHFIDSTVVRAPQHAAGAKRGANRDEYSREHRANATAGSTGTLERWLQHEDSSAIRGDG